MEHQSSRSHRIVIVSGDSEHDSAFVNVQDINELREKISDLQCELKHLKTKKTSPNLPTDSLYQQNLKKINTDLRNFSNTAESTDGFFKTFHKNNTEISNELTALKRKANESFDVEKDLGEPKNEMLDFLNEGMAELQNRTEQLDTEIKNIWGGLKDEHEQVRATIQSTKDLLKNSDQRIIETSNEVKALKESISNSLLVRTEASDNGTFVNNDDLAKLRNGLFNVYGKGNQQEPESRKQLGNEIENVDSAVQSENFLKNQCKDMNEKLIVMENSIKQFSGEIEKLEAKLKAEQQSNIILKKKLMVIEYYLKKTMINYIKQISNKEISTNGTAVTNFPPKESTFVAETNKLKISDSKTKKRSQLDEQSQLLTHDVEWMDIVSKDHNDVNFNEEVKSKYICQGMDQLDNNEYDCRNCSSKIADFSEKEPSSSAVYNQRDDLNENQCTDLAFISSYGKDGHLSYFEKAYAYLQNLQMAEVFTFSDEESLVVSNEGSSASLKLENGTKKGMCSFTFYFTLKLSFYTP